MTLATGTWSTDPDLNVVSRGVAGSGGVAILGTSPPSNFDNSQRDIMAQIESFRTGASFLTSMSLEWNDDGALVGPTLTLRRLSANPAASDIIGRLLFQGKDSAGNTEDYAEIDSGIASAISTAEAATLRLRVKQSGSMVAAATFNHNSAILGGGSATYVIRQSVETESLAVAGGMDPGAAVLSLYGASHGSLASDYTFSSGGSSVYAYDRSATTHTFTGHAVAINASGTPLVANRAEADNTNRQVMGITRNGATLNGISATNTTTTYSTSSDYRLKANVSPLSAAVGLVQKLSPKQFTWRDNPDVGTVHGFIAHEVAGLIPEAVVGDKDAIDEGGKPVYQGVDLAKFVPVLTAALQEAIARIEALEAASQ